MSKVSINTVPVRPAVIVQGQSVVEILADVVDEVIVVQMSDGPFDQIDCAKGGFHTPVDHFPGIRTVRVRQGQASKCKKCSLPIERRAGTFAHTSGATTATLHVHERWRSQTYVIPEIP